MWNSVRRELEERKPLSIAVWYLGDRPIQRTTKLTTLQPAIEPVSAQTKFKWHIIYHTSPSDHKHPRGRRRWCQDLGSA